MDIKLLVGLVSKAAPLLGSVLGGPIGGMAATLIANELGTKTDPASLLNAINTIPEAATKLKDIEYKHQEALLALQQQDLASARSMNDPFVRVILIMLLAVVMLFLVAAAYFERDTSMFPYIMTAIGYIGSEAKNVYRLYFGMGF